MNNLQRWLRFNLVGALGLILQLSALALFNRYAPKHYLGATATAVELAVLHNFLWHLHYTWKDRWNPKTIPGQLIRFHLSNGAVSLLGNLALMPLLYSIAHLPLLAANSMAILSCSLLNFALSNTWAFNNSGVISKRQKDTEGCLKTTFDY